MLMAPIDDRVKGMLRQFVIGAFAACLAGLGTAKAAVVRQAVVATDAEQGSCAAPPSVSSFSTSKRQAVLWFVADRVAKGDEIRVDWVDPRGSISLSAPYTNLPAEPSVCLATQMPIAGFDAAAQPGDWTVNVYVNQRLAISRRFRISSDPIYAAFGVTGIQRRPAADGFELIISGSGFVPGSTVHLATYSRTGGWNYITAADPRSIEPNQITAQHTPLSAGEYWVIIQTPDKILSRPMPFTIATTAAYRLPFPAGQRWVVTQGPYGAFSHWGNSLHAWDIAPMDGRCVVAMRAGVVHTHDVGAVQDHSRRTFGNYITIDHGDGEYSHYAHLASGTFLVHDGEQVQQGQPLAIAGNSGYTLGEGGGYHVHVSVTHAMAIASPSVPFEFEEIPGPKFRGVVLSKNSSQWSDCSRRQPFQRAPVQMAALPSGTTSIAVRSAAPVTLSAAMVTPARVTPAPVTQSPAAALPKQWQFQGEVGIQQWWNDVIVVPRGATVLDAVLQWEDTDAGLDLHLVSPRGEHYGWYANTTGYSGSFTRPQEFRIPNPEPGAWRISVQGVRGGGQLIPFGIETNARRSTTAGNRSAYPGG